MSLQFYIACMVKYINTIFKCLKRIFQYYEEYLKQSIISIRSKQSQKDLSDQNFLKQFFSKNNFLVLATIIVAYITNSCITFTVFSFFFIVFNLVSWSFKFLINDTFYYIRNLKINDFNQTIRDSLQFCKFSRMIWKQYQSRSNTNIMLQHQQEQLMQDEYQIQQITAQIKHLQNLILQLYGLFYELQKKLQRLRLINKKSIQKEKHYFFVPLRLKQILQFNEQFTQCFQQLSLVQFNYHNILLSPFSTIAIICSVSWSIKTQIKSIFKSIKLHINILNRILLKQLQQKTCNLKDLQDYLSSDKTKQSQQVNKIYRVLLRHVSSKDQNEPKEKQEDQIFTIFEDKLNDMSQKQQKKEIVVLPSHQKIKFMKQLDRVFMMSLIRKRQQYFDLQIEKEY